MVGWALPLPVRDPVGNPVDLPCLAVSSGTEPTRVYARSRYVAFRSVSVSHHAAPLP